MSTKEKLINKIKSLPKDFTYQELSQLLGLLGFNEFTKGKTSGSRIGFTNGRIKILLHKPHGSNPIGYKTLSDIVEFLEREKLIWKIQ